TMPGSSTPLPRQPLGLLLARALRLRCPLCGGGRLFQKWICMHRNCSQCGFCFERGPGYWLGSIYVNYGLTALILTGAYFALFFSEALLQTAILWALLIFCAVFPLWFFRYSRAIWIALDLYFDPPLPKEFKKS